ncbi:putative transcription factor B3-Domain family [Helianthus anomalus]
MLKRVKSMPVLTDGWQTVVSDLNLQKDCLLTFLPLNHFGLHLSSYVNGVCESYFRINRYLRLGVTIIEDSFVEQCFGDNPPTGSYEISYKGSSWTVSTSKLHSSYVFSEGWPQLCNDLGIQEDDLLVFEKLDDVLFGLTVYRDEIEIRLSKKVESDDDDVFQISKADYFESLLKACLLSNKFCIHFYPSFICFQNDVFQDIEEDDNIYIPDQNPSFSKTSISLPAGTVPSRTPKKVHVQEMLKKR